MRLKPRELPPACLFIALIRLLNGRLKVLREYKGLILGTPVGNDFMVFRNISATGPDTAHGSCVFIVSFKFSRLSHKANKVASLIPMLLIAGFPGFMHKIYAVNHDNGYWMGMYQWKSAEHLVRYQHSLVFRVMNKRAIPGSIRSIVLPGQELRHFVENHAGNSYTIKNDQG